MFELSMIPAIVGSVLGIVAVYMLAWRSRKLNEYDQLRNALARIARRDCYYTGNQCLPDSYQCPSCIAKETMKSVFS